MKYEFSFFKVFTLNFKQFIAKDNAINIDRATK